MITKESMTESSKAIGSALVAALGEVGQAVNTHWADDPKVLTQMDEVVFGSGKEDGNGNQYTEALYFGITVRVIERLTTWASVEKNGNRFVVLSEDLKELPEVS